MKNKDNNHSVMYRFTYRNGPKQGGEFTSVVNFCASTADELDLAVAGHINKYGVIKKHELEQQDLEFEDLIDD